MKNKLSKLFSYLPIINIMLSPAPRGFATCPFSDYVVKCKNLTFEVAKETQKVYLPLTISNKMEMKNLFGVNVSVFAIKDREHYIVYSPELGVYGYSDESDKDATDDFYSAVGFFLTFHEKKNTLHKELIKLGWNFEKPKPTPPSKVTIPSNLLSLLVSSVKRNYTVDIPAMA